uniref:Uncharacterized protein LOC111115785 n=1 Tax=Crassostrea virginica TaxID=6565 RepID=A0A8B8C625_CRAVI|nr:uncharacterized protein LOC111115785 [Crassostrea virginica]
MMADDIKKFEGSHEERLLQAILKSSRLKTDFLNLVIKSCNVLKPVLFTNADVVLDLMNQCDKELFQEEQEGSELTAVKISFEKVFNMELIEKLSANGVGDLQDEVKPVVLTIMNYLQSIEYHQNAIYNVKRKGGDEARITAVMAQHLFSQLIPGNKYCIDNTSKNLPKVCPCQQPNCGKEIKAGCTALGSGDTWHGYVDILLNNNVAVSVISDDEEHSDDDNPGPSAPKQLCRSSSSVSLCIEDEHGRHNKRSLLNMNVIDQIIAETITNAFAQINLTKTLTGWLIPTFGCTVDQVVAFMYDPKSDVLLQSMDIISCWRAEKTLDLTTVVFIWMLLNFPIFMCKNLADQYEFDRSNFHKLAETKLKWYQTIVSGNDESLNFENDSYAEVVMPKIHYIAKHVRQRNEPRL